MIQRGSGALRGILEAGHTIIADFTTEYRLYVGSSPLEVQDNEYLEPVAIFNVDEQSLNILKLTAAIIVRLHGSGYASIPDVFEGDVVTAKDLSGCDGGESGNVGTVSDNIEVKILDVNGREMNRGDAPS